MSGNVVRYSLSLSLDGAGRTAGQHGVRLITKCAHKKKEGGNTSKTAPQASTVGNVYLPSPSHSAYRTLPLALPLLLQSRGRLQTPCAAIYIIIKQVSMHGNKVFDLEIPYLYHTLEDVLHFFL